MRYRLKFLSLAAACIISGIFPLSAQAVLFVHTGHTGAQVQCDVNHLRYWTYTAPRDISGIDGAQFFMKRGPRTVAEITFAIIEGNISDFGKVPPVFEKILTRESFSQSYSPILFQSAPINLYANRTYTGVLYSSARDPQDEAYFIKDGAKNSEFIVYPPPPPPNGGGGSVDDEVPEPTSLMLLALAGMVFLPAGRARR